ncbi:MAG: aminotransferase class V-fold PLP-dependent enzyme [Lachnospiraceae bacterium]|nr:aminotransferase class V-fold PLP-dependent enzyme [Lachnospiraceae bacterium]
MGSLFEELQNYHEKNIYPFHMPGHKRNRAAVEFQPDLTEDITEIEGFDYLHSATGILRESQEEAARLYGADETYYSVNGSTGALLAAVSACVKPGGALLMARNCHQSVYHGVCLRQLDSRYLYPRIAAPYGLSGAVFPEQVEEALAAHKEAQAVLITSPTYDGVVSPVGEVARVAHAHGVPLIVDEAHGSHFPFHEYFPQSALDQGADVAVHSLHKTLPSLTQTALLHVKGKRVDRERLRRFMGMYQTSSPSYLLMGSMDACIRRLRKSGAELFEAYVDKLKRLRRRLSGFSYVGLLGEELVNCGIAWDYDRSKLILALPPGNVSGHGFSRWLWKAHKLQMEMETQWYVLAMTSVADTDEGFERLWRALKDAEDKWRKCGRKLEKKLICQESQTALAYGVQVTAMSQAVDMEKIKIPFLESAGRVAGDFLYLYPPGIPLVVPGERITSEFVEAVHGFWKAGLTVRGLSGGPDREVTVLKQVLGES